MYLLLNILIVLIRPKNVRFPGSAMREESLRGDCAIIKNLPETIKLLGSSGLSILKCTALIVHYFDLQVTKGQNSILGLERRYELYEAPVR